MWKIDLPQTYRDETLFPLRQLLTPLDVLPVQRRCTGEWSLLPMLSADVKFKNAITRLPGQRAAASYDEERVNILWIIYGSIDFITCDSERLFIERSATRWFTGEANRRSIRPQLSRRISL